jgi:NADH-quinone oxidoreductase subunit G
MIRLTIDGREATVPEGTLVVDAAATVGIDIPIYCYHQALGSLGACRICLVEIEKMPKLMTACTTTAADGMVVHTQSKAAEKGRKGILEFLLINHPLDCPVCDKGGECFLQDYVFRYGAGQARFEEAKIQRHKEYPVSPYILVDQERCVLCQRCVRFMGEYVGEEQLLMDGRGVHTVITNVPGIPVTSPFSGNVIDLCPVGALLSEPYHFRARPWNIEREETYCSQCPVGCPSSVTGRDGKVVRLEGRPTPGQWGWLCDHGRFTYDFGANPRRLTDAVLDGSAVPIGRACQAMGERLRAVVDGHGADAVAILSGGSHMLEDHYALRRFADEVVGTSRIGLVKPVQSDLPLALLGTFQDMEHSDTVLLLGTDPYEGVPVVHLSLRQQVRKMGCKVRALGDRHLLHDTLPGDEWIVAPGAMAASLAAALRAHSDHQDVVRAAEKLESADERLAALGRDLLEANTLTILWDGREPALSGVITALARARGEHGTFVLPTSGPRNWLAAVKVGIPSDFETTRRILEDAAEGRIQALVLWGANPIRDFPDGDLAARALERCPEVYFGGVFPPEGVELMTGILPTAAWAEEPGTYVNMEGRLQSAKGAASAPGQARPTRAILQAVSRAFGTALRKLDEWDPYEGTVDDRVPLPPLDLKVSAIERPATADPVAEGFQLVTGFEVALTHAPSEVAERTREENPVRLHPDDLKRVGVSGASGIIEIGAGERSFRMGVRGDARIPRGRVFVPWGLEGAPVNRLPDTAVQIRTVEEVASR